MSHDAPPNGYRSWLHYTVELMRHSSATSPEELAQIERDLSEEDSRRTGKAAQVLAFVKNWKAGR